MSNIWRSWFGHLTWPFLQLANDLHDTDFLQLLHSRLFKNQNLTQHVANKVDDKEEDVQHVAKEVDDAHEDLKNMKQSLAKTQQSAMLPSSDTVFQQMPLKPAIFYGRDLVTEEITQLLVKEETSRVCVLGPGGTGKTSVALGIVEQCRNRAFMRHLSSRHGFYIKTLSGCLALKRHRQLSKLFAPNCRYLEILGLLRSWRLILYSLPRYSPVWSCSTTSRDPRMRLMSASHV